MTPVRPTKTLATIPQSKPGLPLSRAAQSEDKSTSHAAFSKERNPQENLRGFAKGADPFANPFAAPDWLAKEESEAKVEAKKAWRVPNPEANLNVKNLTGYHYRSLILAAEANDGLGYTDKRHGFVVKSFPDSESVFSGIEVLSYLWMTKMEVLMRAGYPLNRDLMNCVDDYSDLRIQMHQMRGVVAYVETHWAYGEGLGAEFGLEPSPKSLSSWVGTKERSASHFLTRFVEGSVEKFNDVVGPMIDRVVEFILE
jgi:hypothetical protein